ncbi:MAG: hypothetical protein J2O49_11200, partial [Sciscionella sp.]|nr:hypothetical protein [Sciscionella sp.]
FGARGDGNADDTMAIQKALDVASANGGTVYLPAGRYRIRRALITRNNTVLRGDGRAATRIVQASPTEDAINGESARMVNVGIEDLEIHGPGDGRGCGIRLGDASATSSYLMLRNINVQGFGGDGVYLGRWIVSTITGARVFDCGGNGFHIERGTSITALGCFSLRNERAGYRLAHLVYSALSGCATDHCGVGYQLHDSHNITLSACGCESTRPSATASGTGFELVGGGAHGLHSCYSYANTHIAVHVTTVSRHNVITGFRDNEPASTAVASIAVDEHSAATVIEPDLTSPRDYAGAVTELAVGGQSQLVSSGNAAALRATSNTGSAVNNQPVINAQAADPRVRAFGAGVATEPYARWAVDASGALSIGDGQRPRDTTLHRAGPARLRTDGALTVDGSLSTGGEPVFGGAIVVKPAAQTLRGRARPHDDEHLHVELAALSTYLFECTVIYSSDELAGIRFALTAPEQSTVDWFAGDECHTVDTVLTAAGGDGRKVLRFHGVVSTGDRAGRLGMRWAQRDTTGSDTTVHRNSTLRLTKVG